MEQNLNKIENTYNTVAKEYAETFAGEHEKKPMDIEVLCRFIKAVGNREPVWDFGCGPGHTAAYMKRLGIEISGLDISEKTVELAKTAHPGVHFRKGNILNLEFKNNSLAGVIAFYAIVHFTEEQVITAFSEIFRVLQPGGIFLCTYHIGNEIINVNEFLGRKTDIDFMLFSSNFIFSSLDKTGFEKIETTEREPYPGVEYQSRRAYVFAAKPA